MPHYGLLLAGVAGLPSSVIETAKNITKQITDEVSFFFPSASYEVLLFGFLCTKDAQP